ncbi:MAG TPA: ABC transporter ATP-binding protein [Alphaproteobacteria bacterium]|nr:ABC transporter ATP-binding protein [Alphaproteobacteria bacterium]
MAEPLLNVTSLTVAYRQAVALDAASLVVRDGEIVALLGANGAGKSTLLKAVMGFLAPSAGEIVLAGHRLGGLPIERRVRLGLGYCPEGRRIFPGLTVRENLEVAARLKRLARARRLEAAFAVFPALRQQADIRAWQLSGGQQQMLAIGRALMGEPRLLLIDEPSLGLAPRLTAELLERIHTIAAGGTAVLLAEQNVARALAICDRAYLLETGRVRREGRARELAVSDDARKAFLGG